MLRSKPKALHTLGKSLSTEHLCFLVVKAEASGCFMHSDERVTSFDVILALAHMFSHVY